MLSCMVAFEKKLLNQWTNQQLFLVSRTWLHRHAEKACFYGIKLNWGGGKFAHSFFSLSPRGQLFEVGYRQHGWIGNTRDEMGHRAKLPIPAQEPISQFTPGFLIHPWCPNPPLLNVCLFGATVDSLTLSDLSIWAHQCVIAIFILQMNWQKFLYM